jgi:hypothetical protein
VSRGVVEVMLRTVSARLALGYLLWILEEEEWKNTFIRYSITSRMVSLSISNDISIIYISP